MERCHVKKNCSARRRIDDHGSGVRGYSIDWQGQEPGAGGEPPTASEAGNQKTPAAMQANTGPYCVPPLMNGF
jgi:hypothetical protein